MIKTVFWGTRGSLPVSPSVPSLRAKLCQAIKAASEHNLTTDASIANFVAGQLPFSVNGTYGGNTACVELRGGDSQVICDAGTGLREFGNRLIAEGRLARQNRFHLFLSHPHWDHIQGFPFFTPAYIPGVQIDIYAGHAKVEDAFRKQQEPPFFPVPFQAMAADIRFHILTPGETYDIAGFQVNTIAQNHPGGSFGYSFRRQNKKVVYSTDAEHQADMDADDYPFLKFFERADLLIMDAQYTLAEASHTKENWGHGSNIAGVELAIRSRVRHLCLFHHEPAYDDATLEVTVSNTRKYVQIFDPSHALSVSMAYDGLEIEVTD